GLGNAGHHNTGSFNAGNTNSGDFNPGNINTGWFNTGNSNTGLLNTGSVNTGALVSGNYVDGLIWRGNYQGLPGFSLEYTFPVIPVVGADIVGGLGPITVIPPIHIPTIPWYLDAAGAIGPVNIPSIPIPSIHATINPAVNISPISVAPITITGPNITIDYSTAPSFSISGGSSSFVVVASYGFVLPGPITIEGSPAGVRVDSPGFRLEPIHTLGGSLTIPGFTIPTGPINIGLPLSLTIPGFNTPAGGIPSLPLGFGLESGTPSFDLPTAVIDRILFDLHATSTLGPIDIPLAGFGGTPGLFNTSLLPSSGFFNSGGGTVSGFMNFGTSVSGLLNSVSTAAAGSLSGVANFGTQLSGMLSRGTDIAGLYNFSSLDLFASAVISGFNNIGERLSGFFFTNTGP
ncbi:pentapeptide repeat-containing protein, partial [Mycobacterium asiaticum]